MPYDPNFSQYTIEELAEMREQRKQEAAKKREQRQQELKPMLDRFIELYDE